MDVPITIGYSVDIAAELQVTAGFDFEADVEYGIQYEAENGWSPIGKEQTSYHVHDPTFSQQIDITAYTYVEPQFNMDLYGIAGPFFNMQPRIDGQFDENDGQYCVDIGDTIAVNIGAELAWPINEEKSYTLYSFSDTLYDVCQ